VGKINKKAFIKLVFENEYYYVELNYT